jgi:Icc-related predicted phosphoesterase
MKILALADLDGAVPPRSALREVYRAAGIEAVVFAGSVLPPGDVPASDAKRLYTAFFDALAALGLPAVVVPGHLDTPLVLFRQVATPYASHTPPIMVVDRAVASLVHSVVVGGLGGLLAEDHSAEETEATERTLRDALLALAALRQYPGPRVLLVHTPPRGRVVDRHDGRHVGRRAVNRLIAGVGAPVAVCGYAHEGQGKDDIDGTVVVNPGPLADGCYAIIDPLRGSVQFGVLPRRSRRVNERPAERDTRAREDRTTGNLSAYMNAA